MHKQAPTTSSEIASSAQPDHYLTEVGPDTPQSSHSLCPPPHSPPSYISAHEAAIKSGTHTYRPGARWLTVEWSDDCDIPFPPFSLAGTPSENPSDCPNSPQEADPRPLPSRTELDAIPKAPELCQALSDFEQGHSDLRVHVKAIFNVMERLVDAKKRMVDVQEYWMEVGMNDMAHDLIPLLDFAEEAMPRYTFPPLVNQTVAPVM